MRRFLARVALALKFCLRLRYGWRRAWINARRDAFDEHADVHHAGTL